MDQLHHDSFPQSLQPQNRLVGSSTVHHLSESSPGAEMDNNTNNARKVQKADREKLRRDRLNEHFLELAKVLGLDRHKNDKPSILADTIQVVMDLTAQVNRLKAEFTTLTEESRELTQEKNDLREEVATLKSEVKKLNGQYQQKVSYPWGAVDHPVIMHPPPYPMPVPVPMAMPTGPLPMHSVMQPYPFFGAPNRGVISNPCLPFVPYVNNPNPMIDQQSTQQGNTRSPVSTTQGASVKLSDHQRDIDTEKSEALIDASTDLELKAPGFTANTNEDSSSPQRITRNLSRSGNGFRDESSSTKCSSSSSIQDNGSPSSVVGGGEKAGE